MTMQTQLFNNQGLSLLSWNGFLKYFVFSKNKLSYYLFILVLQTPVIRALSEGVSPLFIYHPPNMINFFIEQQMVEGEQDSGFCGKDLFSLYDCNGPLLVSNDFLQESSNGIGDEKTKSTRKSKINGNIHGLIWPLKGRITSKFGPRWGRFHKGIDISAPRGRKIIASQTGTVEFRGWIRGYGNIIIINHGTYKTAYAHLSRYHVLLEQKVSKGQVIGQVGNTGNSFGEHLHFEVRDLKDNPMNPLSYLPSRSPYYS